MNLYFTISPNYEVALKYDDDDEVEKGFHRNVRFMNE